MLGSPSAARVCSPQSPSPPGRPPTRLRQPRRPLDIAQLSREVRFIGHPEPGYYRLKLVRRGPWVPAVIWRPCPLVEPILYEMTPDPEDWCRPTERPRPLRGRIGDREADPFDIWTRARTISAVEYHWRLGLHEWAVDNAPEQPEAQPRRRVDLTDQPSLF